MAIEEKKFYILFSMVLIAGWIWIAFSYYSHTDSTVPCCAGGVCFFKSITQLPCPACGSTRAIMALLSGDIKGAFFSYNPLGLISFSLLCLLPLFILLDLLLKRKMVYNTYRWVETCIRKKYIAIPFFMLLLFNWFWNIAKHL